MILTIIVPCYNEEEVLNSSIQKLRSVLDELVGKKKLSSESSILCVDDGSTDGTWHIIEQLNQQFDNVNGLKLSRNVGHQNALFAGLMVAEGDALLSIDADLQDDTGIIEEMLREHTENHNEVVYAARKKRKSDTFFKRSTAELFYKLMRVMGVKIVFNHADFRLMGRRSIEALREFQEANLFLRGIVTLIGFKSTIVYYDRSARLAGESKYPLKRMLAFALDGITSFSITPLRLITVLGFVVFMASISMSAWILSVAIFTDKTVPGWASTVLPIYFIGGVQIFCIGVLGEYVGKIYREVKRRPRYIIEKYTKNTDIKTLADISEHIG